MELKYKVKKLEPIVLKLLDGTRNFNEVSEISGISHYVIRQIATHHNISAVKVNSIRNKRNLEIKILCDKGLSYNDVGKKLGLSKQSIGRIARGLGVKKYKYNAAYYIDLIQKIEKDYKKGMSYERIKTKYKINNQLFGTLSYYGLSKLYNRFKNNRDVEIVNQYKKVIAKKVVKSNRRVLKDPKKIKTLASVYHISSDHGFKKHPNIGSRCYGGVFLPKVIINTIKRKREKEGMHFSQIAEYLNSKNYLTATGVPYTHHNVRFKYFAIKKCEL